MCDCSKSVEELCGKRIVMFSYGSGLAAAMYSFRVSNEVTSALRDLLSSVSNIPERLSARTVVPPAKFEELMKLRQETHHSAPYQPQTSCEDMFPGTFYLTAVDGKHRRSYSQVNKDVTTHTNGTH